MTYELYHHGIKGQKWGVRRYQNKDGSLTPAGKKRVAEYEAKSKEHVSAIGDSSTRIGKNYHNRKAYKNTLEAEKLKSKEAHKDASALKKFSNEYSHGSSAIKLNAKADYYNRKSEYTKTRVGTTKVKAKAYNMRTAADMNTRLHNSKSAGEYGRNFAEGFSNRPMKSWAGRTTTSGKRLVDSMLTGKVGGTVLDVGYYVKETKKNTA
jgi:hypothetical protein